MKNEFLYLMNDRDRAGEILERAQRRRLSSKVLTLVRLRHENIFIYMLVCLYICVGMCMRVYVWMYNTYARMFTSVREM